MMVITVFVVLILAFILAFVFVYMSDDGGYRYSDENITLGFVPDGMECVFSESTTNTISAYFSDDSENYFVIYRCSKNANMSVDTENGTVENITINKHDAAYITTPNGNTLIWYVGDFVYNLYGNISKEFMVRIAENVNR